jgi:putative flippase GtrA
MDSLPYRWMHLIRFLAVGGLNTLFGYCLFALQIWLGVPPEIAILIGNIVGPLFNYVTYGKLAFSQKLGRHNLPRYVANYAVFYLINIALLRLFLETTHMSAYLAQLILTPFLALGQYFSLRYFVFRKTPG